MKITKIEQQKGKKNRYSIFCDCEYKFSLCDEILIKSKLKEEISITESEIEKLKAEDAILSGKNYAFNILSRRDYSENELRKKMRDKKFPKTAIENTIQYMKELNLINDARFAKIWTENRITLNPKGRYLILNELIQKGIEKKFAQNLVDEVYTFEKEVENAQKLVIKKVRTWKKPYSQKDINKILNYLNGKGFPYDCIKEIFKRLDITRISD